MRPADRCAQPTGGTNHRGTELTEADTHRGRKQHATGHMPFSPFSSSNLCASVVRFKPTGDTNHRGACLTDADPCAQLIQPQRHRAHRGRNQQRPKADTTWHMLPQPLLLQEPEPHPPYTTTAPGWSMPSPPTLNRKSAKPSSSRLPIPRTASTAPADHRHGCAANSRAQTVAAVRLATSGNGGRPSLVVLRVIMMDQVGCRVSLCGRATSGSVVKALPPHDGLRKARERHASPQAEAQPPLATPRSATTGPMRTIRCPGPPTVEAPR